VLTQLEFQFGSADWSLSSMTVSGRTSWMILVERDRRRVRVSLMPMLLFAECVRTSDPGTDMSAARGLRAKELCRGERTGRLWDAGLAGREMGGEESLTVVSYSTRRLTMRTAGNTRPNSPDSERGRNCDVSRSNRMKYGISVGTGGEKLRSAAGKKSKSRKSRHGMCEARTQHGR